MYLSRYARKVHICIRGKDLGHSMSRYLVDRIDKAGNIQVHKGHVVSAVEGGETLREVRLRCLEKGEEVSIPSRALFLFIGAVPRTGWLSGCVALDRRGFVLTGETLPPAARDGETWKNAGRTPFFLETSLPGVFAAGDVRAGSVKRVASAVGEGSMSVTFVHAHIGAAV
jgi:thioredoxin reductase (NADPH)